MRHALIVGAQSVGKSALIRKVVAELGCTICGFETEKEDGPGRELHIYKAGQTHRATRENLLGYCRDRRPMVIEGAFDRAARLLSADEITGDVIVMDEIGTMEAASPVFCAAVTERLDGDIPVLAAVKHKDTVFLNAVRNHPDCRCFFITEENRDVLFPDVLRFMRAQLPSSVDETRDM